MIRSNGYFNTPPVVKNLLIVNALVFMAEMVLPTGIRAWMMENMTLNFWKGGDFHLYQLVTYMFMHGNFTHILTNMFALWMFGRILEYDMGSRRFFVYYMVSGIGAGLIQLGVNWAEYAAVVSEGVVSAQQLYRVAHASTLGASGAVFGVLLAFGMLHPNNVIMLLFPPIALKAKWFVIIYGVFELLAGISGTSGGVAHFAHLGGMLWGYLLLRWWKKRGELYY